MFTKNVNPKNYYLIRKWVRQTLFTKKNRFFQKITTDNLMIYNKLDRAIINFGEITKIFSN